MKVTYIILAHNEPQFLKRIVECLSKEQANVLVHYDLKASRDDYSQLIEHFSEETNVEFISKVKGEWGKWSLVEATLEALNHIAQSDWSQDYVHLMSGVEYPIKSIESLSQFLGENNYDFIESVDFTKKQWVRAGLEAERFQYFYPYSYQKPSKVFDEFLELQKSIGVKRKPPLEIEPRLGSQWWTLRWSTCLSILSFLKKNPQVTEYFETTLIPDESFFQTMVAHLVPAKEIRGVQLVCHELMPNGRPFVFRNGHEDIVKDLPHYTIRKVSSTADELLDEIDQERLKNRKIPSLDHLKTAQHELVKKITAMFYPKGEFVWDNDQKHPCPSFYRPELIAVYFTNDEALQSLYVEQVKKQFPEPVIIDFRMIKKVERHNCLTHYLSNYSSTSKKYIFVLRNDSEWIVEYLKSNFKGTLLARLSHKVDKIPLSFLNGDAEVTLKFQLTAL